MAKIVELEKQLMQRNKELDVIRVRATRQLWLGVVMDLLRVLRLGGNDSCNGPWTSVSSLILSLGWISTGKAPETL